MDLDGARKQLDEYLSRDKRQREQIALLESNDAKRVEEISQLEASNIAFQDLLTETKLEQQALIASMEKEKETLCSNVRQLKEEKAVLKEGV